MAVLTPPGGTEELAKHLKETKLSHIKKRNKERKNEKSGLHEICWLQ